jgi:hypothetical protein
MHPIAVSGLQKLKISLMAWSAALVALQLVLGKVIYRNASPDEIVHHVSVVVCWVFLLKFLTTS